MKSGCDTRMSPFNLPVVPSEGSIQIHCLVWTASVILEVPGSGSGLVNGPASLQGDELFNRGRIFCHCDSIKEP